MNYEPIPGQPHNPSEEETMSVIRSVLTEVEEPAPRRKALRAARSDGKSRAFVERTSQPAPRRRAADFPVLQDCDAADTGSARSARSTRRANIAAKMQRHLSDALSAIGAFRPTTRHVALVTLALLVVVRPHWFVIAAVLSVALVLGVFLIVGSDRLWRIALARLAYLDTRDPVRACVLRDRLDRFACRWDAILDIFPDGMVDGLYMPDLQAMQHGDAAHTAAMTARLDRMVQDV